MSAENSTVEETALTLEPHRRAQLAAALIKSLAPADADAVDVAHIEKLWLTEAQDRIARYRAGEVNLVPWSEIKQRLLARHK